MKKVFIFSILLISSFHLFSQTVETLRIKGSKVEEFLDKTGYKYPAYAKAKIYFKTGDVASGRLNFDYFNQEMKYIGEKEDTLAIANTADIKYIAFATDTFFYDNGYLEWTASSATARITSKTKYKLADKELRGAYGITNPGAKIDAIDAFRDAFNTSALIPDQEYVFLKTKTYYISEIDGHFVELNKKNLSKFFPKKDIESYIKENKLNLNKEQDLIDVFVYASKPQ